MNKENKVFFTMIMILQYAGMVMGWTMLALCIVNGYWDSFRPDFRSVQDAIYTIWIWMCPLVGIASTYVVMRRHYIKAYMFDLRREQLKTTK